MAQIEIHRDIHAPAQTVWDAISDHERMVDWTPLRRVTLVEAGDGHRNGIGAVRRLDGPGPTIEEQVTAWQPPSSFEYKLLRGIPVRDYRGRIEVSGSGEHAHVAWSVSFEPKIWGTGWLLQAAIKRTFGSMLGRLARLVEQR